MASIQDLSNYNEVIEEEQTDIRTEYVEPITSNTYKYTFRLDQTGYLDENSMLVFKLKATDGTGVYRVNNWNGALGGIKRVIFQVGDNILNDVSEIYKYATLHNMNLNTISRNEYLGQYLGNQLWSDVVQSSVDSSKGDADSLAYFAQDPKNTVGTIVVDGGKSGVEFGRQNDGDGARNCSRTITNNSANNEQYGIPLGMIIPALKGQKIPLFLFQDQRILITVEFNTSDFYVNDIRAANITYTNAGECADSASGSVIPDEVRLVVDYIIAPTEIQNQIIEQTKAQGGYRLEFFDVVNVEKNVVAGTDGTTQEIEHRIGQNGREVHNIVMWRETTKDHLQDGASNARNYALTLKQHCLGFEVEEYNCNVNGRDEFQDFVSSPVAQYNEMKEVLGSDLKVDAPMYSNDSNTSSTVLASSRSGLLGMMKPLGLSLSNGEPLIVGGGRQIGNYPIVWKWRRLCRNAQVQNCRGTNQPVKCNYFIELSRIANIMNTGRGTNVIVSY